MIANQIFQSISGPVANNDHIFESTFIEIDKKEFDTNKNIIIGLIYKPPINFSETI